jgi:hypothetical protein
MRAAMGRKIKFVVVLALLALMPLRAIAAVTLGVCALAEKAVATHVDAAHAHAEGDHAPSQDDSKSPCNLCAEHCGSAAFAAPAADSPLAVPGALQRAASRHLLPPGLTPEELDRPPIVV